MRSDETGRLACTSGLAISNRVEPISDLKGGRHWKAKVTKTYLISEVVWQPASHVVQDGRRVVVPNLSEGRQPKRIHSNFDAPRADRQKVVLTQEKNFAARLGRMGFSVRRSKQTGGFVLKKRLTSWELFQEKVRAFLGAWGCEDVESGQASWLGRYQIDAIGGYDGTLLVFECKTSQQLGRKKVTKEINIFAGKKAELEAAIGQKFRTKYTEVKFILALDGIGTTERDWQTARDNDIHIWPDGYLTAIGDLFSIVGPRSLHYVLKELGVGLKLVRDEEGGVDYRVPAFRVTINGQQIYSFFLPAEKLLNLVYVFRLQPGNQEAYQRFISKARIFGSGEERGITDFIKDGGFFKNSIVCSFERPIRFEPKPTGLLLGPGYEFGVLSIPKYHGTVWVIDGQHRIYGYAGAPTELQKTPLGVVAYQDLEKKLQARDFIDINQKQKSVDPNTLWELLAQTDPASLSGAITRLVKVLNARGFFEGRIFLPGKALRHAKRRFPLKLANICKSIHDLDLLDRKGRDNLYISTDDVTDESPYSSGVLEHAANVIDQYFTVVWDIAEAAPAWRQGFILHNNGVNVFLRVLVEILRFKKGAWDKQQVRDLLQKPLAQFFEARYEEIDEIRATRTSNEAGRARVALDIMRTIHAQDDSFARNLIADIERRERAEREKSEPYKILMSLENSLRQLITRKLSALRVDWWSQLVPGDIQQKAQERLKKSQSPWPWVKAEEKETIYYIDFPDYGSIVTTGKNWKEVFESIFGDREVLLSKFRELADIRNKVAHYRILSLQESKALNLYAEQILTSIQQATESKGQGI